MEKIRPNAAVLAIFGATGNLTNTKLIPALYELFKGDLLPEKLVVLGVARKDFSKADYCANLLATLEQNLQVPVQHSSWQAFSRNIEFFHLDFNDQEDFAALRDKLDELETEAGICFNRIFYLATAPSFFPIIFEALKKYELNLGCQLHSNPSRIVVEKPFGKDYPTAKELNAKLDSVFSEEQIYRIDHYLAKESVQNMLAFRFANEIFEPILNNKFVDHIQIVQAEESGVENRGEYYEEAGALRDIIQNHLLQLLAITTMDEPDKPEPNHVRNHKVKVLEQVRDTSGEAEKFSVAGQYVEGQSAGEKVPGYRQEAEVSPTSETETFVALKLFIDNANWQGVPIYLKTGKRLAKTLTTITVQFKETGHALFGDLDKHTTPNLLTFQIQPDEGISIRLVAKKPGLKTELSDVDMEFCYASAFREKLPDAYERLLLDIMLGDQTLFPHVAEVLRSWEIVDKIRQGWVRSGYKTATYPAGSWGPKEADDLIQKDGRQWLAHELKICQLHHQVKNSKSPG